MLPWLPETDKPTFPDTQFALNQPNGLLAAGGKLSPEWLITAYNSGIFPWFSEGEPIMWWSPAPRTVLLPQLFHQSKSLKKKIRQLDYEVQVNQNFNSVLKHCSEPREDQAGTWITESMKAAYIRLNQLGHAHSWEFYLEGELLGGLYGVVIGRVFFGESMFSLYPNASKITLAHLVQSNQFDLIDCQMPTKHLSSMGAIELEREEFETLLAQYC